MFEEARMVITLEHTAELLAALWQPTPCIKVKPPREPDAMYALTVGGWIGWGGMVRQEVGLRLVREREDN